jgi:arginyl-tRNA synthetase
MATLTITGLEELLGGLGLKVPVPHFPTADILNKPLDIGRSYLADILCSLVECNAAGAYNSISWPGDIYNGDLAVILPKLSHGSAAKDLALEVTKRVCHFHSFLCIYLRERFDLTRNT